nr:MAG TPA: hypothetical protein [Caudoviricetes sp.]
MVVLSANETLFLFISRGHAKNTTPFMKRRNSSSWYDVTINNAPRFK